MPDGLSHLIIGYSFGKALKKDRPLLSLLLLGSILPDLAQKPFYFFYKKDYYYYLQASHSIFTMVFACALISMFIKNIEFKKSFSAIFTGVLTHFFFDAFQYGFNSGGYRFLIPLYNQAIYYPLYKSHDWYYVLLPSLAVSVVFFIVAKLRKKNNAGVV